MVNKIEELLSELSRESLQNPEEIEIFRIKYLSKKGIISLLFDDFRNIKPEDKKLTGLKLNELKKTAESLYISKKIEFEFSQLNRLSIDKSLSGDNIKPGSRHPISLIKNEICSIFKRLGFTISEGPEIEDDWHVFSALNFPLNHPARDMQDTFFIEKNPDILLRTHTSSVQIRIMEQTPPPIKIIMPGRVFRNEAISARAHCIFHQVEGLYINEDVSFADLKQTLLFFAKEMFGQETKIRLRPSFFPFTEPSAEMDISCSICGGKGCNLCKGTGWLEILGCGMVDPHVLANCKIDNKKYSGYAFGMGIERIALLKYYVKDIRLYFENDIRFLNQFISAF